MKPPNKQRAAAGEKALIEATSERNVVKLGTSHGAKQPFVAIVDTSRGNQLRVSISTWRDQTKIEVKPYSATIPDLFMPCGPGVSIAVERVHDLIALQQAEAEAVRRGFLPYGRAS